MSQPGPRPAAQLDSRAAALTAHQRRVLDLLLEHPDGLTITQVGRIAGIHANTARDHVAALEDAGLVTTSVRRGGGRGRPGRTYVAQAAPPGAASAHMAGLVRLLMESMDDDDRAHELGRAWARDLVETGRVDSASPDPAREVARLLAEMGFAPELRSDAINLYRCPFVDEDGRLPARTCEVHRGALEALMEAFRAMGTASMVGSLTLQPFGGPGVCRITLTPADPAATGNAPAAGHTPVTRPRLEDGQR